MAANTLTRTEGIDAYVELAAWELVLANCRTYNEPEYIEEPRGLAIFDGGLVQEFLIAFEERVDDLAHEFWPTDVELDKDAEFGEASRRVDARVAQIFASLARSQEYFLDGAIRFAKMGTAARQSSEGDDDDS